MVTITASRVQEFTQRTYLAILATVYPSGGPQAFPVWYEFDGERFMVTTEAESAKVHNISHNPKVALCITDTSRWIKSLTVRGTAQVIADNRLAQELHDAGADRAQADQAETDGAAHGLAGARTADGARGPGGPVRPSGAVV